MLSDIPSSNAIELAARNSMRRYCETGSPVAEAPDDLVTFLFRAGAEWALRRSARLSPSLYEMHRLLGEILRGEEP